MAETIVIQKTSRGEARGSAYLRVESTDGQRFYAWNPHWFTQIEGATSISVEVDRSHRFAKITMLHRQREEISHA